MNGLLTVLLCLSDMIQVSSSQTLMKLENDSTFVTTRPNLERESMAICW